MNAHHYYNKSNQYLAILSLITSELGSTLPRHPSSFRFLLSGESFSGVLCSHFGWKTLYLYRSLSWLSLVRSGNRNVSFQYSCIVLQKSRVHISVQELVVLRIYLEHSQSLRKSFGTVLRIRARPLSSISVPVHSSLIFLSPNPT